MDSILTLTSLALCTLLLTENRNRVDLFHCDRGCEINECSLKDAPDLLRVLRYRDTLSCQIMALVGSVFDDGEAYIQTLLSRLAEPKAWEKVVGASSQGSVDIRCPLVYSDAELLRQTDELSRCRSKEP